MDAGITAIPAHAFQGMTSLEEIIEYGNGEFAIGFAGGNVDSSIQGKTITLNLNVFLEGSGATPATTMKLKLTLVKAIEEKS